jgi:diguanylate cyclase (GGDEF)-like protein
LEGDKALVQFATTLDRAKRSTDIVARYGGEEFALVLPEVSKLQALEIAKRHLENIQAHCPLSASFGVASFPEDGASTTELVDFADRALYAAKAQGKNRVVAATPKVG